LDPDFARELDGVTGLRKAFEEWNLIRENKDLKRNGRNTVQFAAYKIEKAWSLLENKIFEKVNSSDAVETTMEAEKRRIHRNVRGHMLRWGQRVDSIRRGQMLLEITDPALRQKVADFMEANQRKQEAQ